MADVDTAPNILTLNISGLLKKTNFIKVLIKESNCDFIFLQETNIQNNYSRDKVIFNLGLTHGNHIFSYADQQHSGTCILQTSNRWKVTNSSSGLNGRLAQLDISKDNTFFSLVSIYVPCDGFRRVPFIQHLERYLLKNTKPLLILGGDFNCTINEIDITGRKGPSRQGRKELKHLMQFCNLKDAYRSVYPDTIVTTHTNTDKKRAARIDAIFVSNNIHVHAAKHIHNTPSGQWFTDHSAVHTTLGKTNTVNNRTSYWKFNDSLLDNPLFVNKVKHIFSNNFSNFLNAKNKIGYYSMLKTCTINIAKNEGYINKQNISENIKILTNIDKLADNQDLYPDFKDSEEHIKAQNILKELNTHQFKGAQIRSKLLLPEDEKPNSTFLKLENNLQGAKEINQIKNKNNDLITDPVEISRVFKSFYDDLFKKEKTKPEIQDKYLLFSNQINNNDRDGIPEEIAYDEIIKAVDKLNQDSSPGSDGLTSKFYIFFKSELTPFLKILVKEIYDLKELPKEHKLSYITLLPKDNTDPLFPKNYRPISLLNTEYKILSNILVNRLAPHMETLIHTDQTCAIKNRSIFTHGHYIRDLIDHSHKTQSHTCILSIDQAKAFDRVDHVWLQKVLRACNLGPFFENWIKILYTNAESKLLINHKLSDTISIERGVRQGDPLSGFLYLLSIEPLLNCIRADPRMETVIIPGDMGKILAGYADDTNFFIKKYSSIDLIIDHFRLFSDASGSLINVEKTQALALGTWKKTQFNVKHKIKYVDTIKILGFYFTKNPSTCGKANWDKAFKKSENILHKFYIKSTSLFGRAIIVNSLIEPQFIYPMHIFDPPKEVIKKYNQLVRNFVLKGSNHHIKQSILFLPKDLGGINLHSLELKHITMRMKFIRKFIEEPEKPEMSIINYYLSYHLRKHVNFKNNKPHCMSSLPCFYAFCKNVYALYSDIITKMSPMKFYECLITRDKLIVDKDIKKLQPPFSSKHIFPILHNTSKTTQIQKQITYRLIHGITGTTNHQNKNRKNNFIFCSICKTAPETEHHLFLSCPSLSPLRIELIRSLRLPHNTYNDKAIVLERAILLNIYPFNNKSQCEIRNIILAIYREIIWQTRNSTKWDGKQYTKQQLVKTFKYKLKFQLDKFTTTNDWEQYSLN